jgi:hypothetical protein
MSLRGCCGRPDTETVMIPDWTLFVLLPAAMGAGVFTGTWLARTGYDNGFRDGFAQAVNDAEMGAEIAAGELEPEPTEQQTMDFLAAVRDDEPGEITGPFVITDADPPRAPRLMPAQRRRAVKKGRIPRDLPGQGPLRPLRPRNGGLGETLGGPLAGELHHEPPTLERLEALPRRLMTWEPWHDCQMPVFQTIRESEAWIWHAERFWAAHREQLAGLEESVAGFDAIVIPRLEAA